MSSLVQCLSESDKSLIEMRKSSGYSRWDAQDVTKFSGTYGNYLLGKVSKVFPELA